MSAMNLSALIHAAPEPHSVATCLDPFFDRVETEHRDRDRIFPYALIARDETGRIRLRLPYLWSERLEKWVWVIMPGDRA